MDTLPHNGVLDLAALGDGGYLGFHLSGEQRNSPSLGGIGQGASAGTE